MMLHVCSVMLNPGKGQNSPVTLTGTEGQLADNDHRYERGEKRQQKEDHLISNELQLH